MLYFQGGLEKYYMVDYAIAATRDLFWFIIQHGCLHDSHPGPISTCGRKRVIPIPSMDATFCCFFFFNDSGDATQKNTGLLTDYIMKT